MSDKRIKIIPVILSGGNGTRLWPVSTEARPKQFQCLLNSQSLLETTLHRVSDSTLFEESIIIGSEKHHDFLKELVRDTKIKLILEPFGKNTAPAIAIAAFSVRPTDTLLILPSDHSIKNELLFKKAVQKASVAAQLDWLVTLGITPTAPATGFGYIQLKPDQKISDSVFEVNKFVEKPSLEDAECMLKAGGFVWNAGIFVFTAEQYLKALQLNAPDIYESSLAAFKSTRYSNGAMLLDTEIFSKIRSDSIDYAVMEKYNRVGCVPVEMGWSDVGSWDAIYDFFDKDENGNVIVGNVTEIDCNESMLRSDGPVLMAYGVEDLIVVASSNGILILPKGKTQEVKNLLSNLKKIPLSNKL